MSNRIANWSNSKPAILRIRALVLKEARAYMNSERFVEVQGPVLLPAVGERPGGFEVNFYNEKSFLAQGLQPYSYAFTRLLGKVFTVAPTFRAEKVADDRHLSEFWRIEAAAGGMGFEDLLNLQERLIGHICDVVVSQGAEELKSLGRSVKNLEHVKLPLVKLTYDEAVALLQKNGTDIVWGERLGEKSEHALSLLFSQPFFVTRYPAGEEGDFFERVENKEELSLSVDLFAPEGVGELASGGQLIFEQGALRQRLGEMELESADENWFLSLAKVGSIRQSVFSLGLERAMQWLCRIKDIRYTTAFPRQRGLFYP